MRFTLPSKTLKECNSLNALNWLQIAMHLHFTSSYLLFLNLFAANVAVKERNGDSLNSIMGSLKIALRD